MTRAFDNLSDEPCPVCLRLVDSGSIQPRAVMPLPRFPGKLRSDGTKCCRDCQATDATMALGFQHPEFAAARLTIANERIEGTLMPFGMMERFGLCRAGFILPSSIRDLDRHIQWLERSGIANSCSLEEMEGETEVMLERFK